MIDQQIEIPTKDGHTTTFITHPERGGSHPVIIFYMDAPAIREELRDMARRRRMLAGALTVSPATVCLRGLAAFPASAAQAMGRGFPWQRSGGG